MNHDELKTAIKRIKEEIYRMKQQIEETNELKKNGGYSAG